MLENGLYSEEPITIKGIQTTPLEMIIIGDVNKGQK